MNEWRDAKFAELRKWWVQWTHVRMKLTYFSVDRSQYAIFFFVLWMPKPIDKAPLTPTLGRFVAICSASNSIKWQRYIKITSTIIYRRCASNVCAAATKHEKLYKSSLGTALETFFLSIVLRWRCSVSHFYYAFVCQIDIKMLADIHLRLCCAPINRMERERDAYTSKCQIYGER